MKDVGEVIGLPISCPCCGDLPELIRHGVQCFRCGLSMESGSTETAVRAWNRRPEPLVRQVRAETLCWVANELETQIEELRQDWVSVLLKSSVRARINALSETAAMCRKAAAQR